MKKSLVLLLALSLLSVTCMAAPLTDFSPGHASLDATLDFNNASTGDGIMPYNMFSSDLNGMSIGSDFAATFGIAQGSYGGFAVQTKIANYAGPNKSKTVDSDTADTWLSVEKQEYNLVYQLPLTGVVSVQPYIGVDFVNAGLGSKADSTRAYLYTSSYGFHGGVAVSAPLSQAWTVFGNIDGGNTYFDIGAGVAYSVTKNLDINAGLKFDGFSSTGINSHASDDGATVSDLMVFSPYIGATLKI